MEVGRRPSGPSRARSAPSLPRVSIAGIFDQSIGLDRDAADGLLEAGVDELGLKRRRRLQSDGRGKKDDYGG